MKSWRGHDYALHTDVERTREEWEGLKAKATRTLRSDGYLLLFNEHHRIVAEVYDRD
jgi:hypothetical protein